MTVCYETDENKYVQYRLMPDEFTTDTTQWAIAEEGVYVENPEFVYLKTDKDDKILWAIKKDGSIYYGAGIPQQVIDYIEKKIAELSLDEYEDIVAFLNNLEKGDKTLQTLLNEKVDKEEGKSLIDAEYASSIQFIENPEFVGVWLDNEEKILFGVQTDGNFLFGCGIPKQVKEYIEQKIEKLPLDSIVTFIGEYLNNTTLEELLSKKVDGEYVENPEFMEVELDADDNILSGRKTDGTKFENNDVELNGNATVGGSLKVDGVVIKNSEDPENRSEITLDSEQKIISYRKDDGTLVENAGIETKKLHLDEQGMAEFQQDLKETGFKPRQISTPYNLPKYGTVNIKHETFYLSAEGWDSYANDVELRQLYADTDANAESYVTISRFYTTNNVPLLFFAASKVNGLVGTASVTKVNGVCYYTDTLAYNNNTNIYSVLEHSMVATVAKEPAEQKSVNVEVAVKEVTDVPPYNAWAVNKKDEHYCVADVNFGHYLTKNNAAVGVKYQGSSTLKKRKRNLRFTFYKNNTFAKKNKIKIGEFVRLSGYNLKANWSDNTRTKELILYRLILDVWKNRPITDRFPWDKQFGYFTGATGNINGFNIRTNIGGIFYGLHTFGLKKDEKNYMLDGTDESGIFVCGARRDATCWTTSTAGDWEDEMMDEMSQDTADALNVFLSFINNRLYKGSDNSEYLNTELTYFVGETAYTYNDVTVEDGKVVLASDTSVEIDNIYVTSTLSEGQPVESSVSAELIPFDKENAPERMDILGWIDYFICMQTNEMWDSICRNMILFSQSDKKRFYPYFYDLDLSL